MSVLHRQPIDGESPEEAPAADSAKAKTPSWRPKRATCPECNQEFQPVHVRQSFCSNEHKAAFHNRATVRGRMLVPVAMASRITRDGCAGDTDTGKRARRDSRRLIDKWAKEDREAGRMSMVEYMRQRHAIGYCRGLRAQKKAGAEASACSSICCRNLFGRSLWPCVDG